MGSESIAHEAVAVLVKSNKLVENFWRQNIFR